MQPQNVFIHEPRFRTPTFEDDSIGDEVLAVLAGSSSDERSCSRLARCAEVRLGPVAVTESEPVAHGSLRVIAPCPSQIATATAGMFDARKSGVSETSLA
jgi:hypothetical protein